MSFQEELEKILEDLHEKLLIGWIKNDGKTHVIPSHTNKDGCINDTLTSIINLVDKEVIGEDESESGHSKVNGSNPVLYFAHRNELRAEQRNKLRGE